MEQGIKQAQPFETGIRIYSYRWVILLFFFILNAFMQTQWILFAPITNEAVAFYKVPAVQIDLLSLIFMIVYLFVSFPASYVIDKWGIRIGIGLGAVLLGVFSLLKGVYGGDYTMVVVSQIGIAMGQPFVLNSVTKVAVRWFPITERATAAGISVLAQFIGIIVAMAATPVLYSQYGMEKMLMIYGVATFIGCVLFIIFNREQPPTPPCPPGHEERIAILAGLKHIFKQRDMVYMTIIFFIGLGIFNAVTTWMGQILAPRGFSLNQIGTAGAVDMIGGIIGACVIPVLSDRLRKRKFFILLCAVFTLPGMIGFTFAGNYGILLMWTALMGFFSMGGGPVNFQYVAEISYPAPEATSQGILMLAGQISGIIFIFGMDMLMAGTTSKTPAMLVFIGLSILNLFFIMRLKESRLIKTEAI